MTLWDHMFASAEEKEAITNREDYEQGQQDGSQAGWAGPIGHAMFDQFASDAYKDGWDNGWNNRPKS